MGEQEAALHGGRQSKTSNKAADNSTLTHHQPLQHPQKSTQLYQMDISYGELPEVKRNLSQHYLENTGS